MLDFEKAVWLAIGKKWTHVTLRGCFFHWTQAVERRIDAEKLTHLNTTPDDRRICRLLLALPLIPEKLITVQFNNIKSQVKIAK
jgi:hypothetical protein